MKQWIVYRNITQHQRLEADSRQEAAEQSVQHPELWNVTDVRYQVLRVINGQEVTYEGDIVVTELERKR